MKRAIAAVAVAILVAAVAPPLASAQDAFVSIDNRRFVPDFVQITEGDTVTWSNDSDEFHSVTADNNTLFDSRLECGVDNLDACVLEPDETFEVEGLPPGDYPYHCEIHSSMRGLLVVDAQTTTTTSSSTTTTTTTTTTSTTTTSTTSTTLPTTTSTVASSTTTVADEDDGGGGSGLTWLLVALIVMVIGGIIAVATSYYRNRELDREGPGPLGPPPPPGPPAF